jgi:TPR repeat protein
MHCFFPKAAEQPQQPYKVTQRFDPSNKKALKTAYKRQPTPETAFNLGYYYQFPPRGNPNPIKMHALYDEAIQGGHIDATYYKGLYYHNAGDLTNALIYYKKSAEQGHARSLYILGFKTHERLTIPITREDSNRVIEYYTAAFERGFLPALTILGYYYQMTEPDEDKMFFYYRKAIRLSNNPTAYYGLARYYAQLPEPDHDLANTYYRLAIEHIDKFEQYSEYAFIPKSSIASMTCLGNYYATIEKNPVEMMRYHEMAISHGSTESANALGRYFYFTDYRPRLARKYFTIGEKAGSVDSLYYLGMMAHLVDGDVVTMKRNYLKAIKAGHSRAMFFLGEFYLTEYKWDLAIDLFRQSLKHGFEPAEVVKDRIVLTLKLKYNVLEAHADQTVHIPSIADSSNQSIATIIRLSTGIKSQNPITIDEVANYIKGLDPTLSIATKSWLADQSTHSIHKVTFAKLLGMVSIIIENHVSSEDRDALRERLKVELFEAVGECFTARMDHTVNSLVGFVEGVSVTVTPAELRQMRIGRVIDRLVNKNITYNEAVGLIEIVLVGEPAELAKETLQALDDYRPE